LKQRLSTPVLTSILVLSAGVIFPIIFSLTDKILRTLLVDLDPVILMFSSFAWLLLFHFFGIKFSIEYITRQFELTEKKRLFKLSNISFFVVSLFFYSFLISASWLSNLIWGSFYLTTIGFFYWLSSKELLNE
jgi:hypothetical protein